MIDNFSYELFSLPKFESVIISISEIHNIVYKKHVPTFSFTSHFLP